MSSTERRRKDSEPGAQSSQDNPAKSEGVEPEAEGPGARGRARRRKPAAGARALESGLPAFGFAKDLLPELSEKAAGDEKHDEAAVGPPAGPERIFTFADNLEGAAGDEEPAVEPTRLSTWVTFSLSDEVFALPVEPVREVLRVTSITRVPHAPEPIRGVSNLRGRVIPVIDLRVRIGLTAADLDRASRVIVVGSRGRSLGLLVDAVHHVVRLDLDQVQAPPEDVMTAQSDYISGVYHLGEQLVLLLDVDRALIVRNPAGQEQARESGAA